MAFSTLEPFGGPVEDLRAGIGAAVAVTMNRAPPEPGHDPAPAMSPLAWYPWHAPPAPPPPAVFHGTPEELAERLESLLMSLGSKHGN